MFIIAKEKDCSLVATAAAVVVECEKAPDALFFFAPGGALSRLIDCAMTQHTYKSQPKPRQGKPEATANLFLLE